MLPLVQIPARGSLPFGLLSLSPSLIVGLRGGFGVFGTFLPVREMTLGVRLEVEAAEFAAATAALPCVEHIEPEQGRKILDYLQTTIMDSPMESIRFDCGHSGGAMDVKFFTPIPQVTFPKIIFFCHGGGWVFGNAQTHHKLIRELSNRCKAIVLFPEYSLSPEAPFPTALDQMECLIRALPQIAESRQWDINNLTIAGDSAGGNLATVLANTLVKDKTAPQIHKQLLYYPVTDSKMDTPSYTQFATGYFLTRRSMKWHWNQYVPRHFDRQHPRISPLQTPLSDLKQSPPTMIITAQADILRDEAQLYADRLKIAGVKVVHHVIPATVHGFVLANTLDQTKACRTAMNLSTEWINAEL